MSDDKYLECFAIGRSSGRGEFKAFECYDDLFAEIKRLFGATDGYGELMVKKTSVPVSEVPYWEAKREKRHRDKLAHYKECHLQQCEICDEVEDVIMKEQ